MELSSEARALVGNPKYKQSLYQWFIQTTGAMSETNDGEEERLFTSKEELFSAFDDYKKDTCTGWRSVYKNATFGKFINIHV